MFVEKFNVAPDLQIENHDKAYKKYVLAKAGVTEYGSDSKPGKNNLNDDLLAAVRDYDNIA